ncbi:hypothetical protein, partial [Pseudomonas sp. W5-36]|uniref:hypothetical protein n=1 Tax=Pseudomonas sp. W5-36 TaxID=3097455 RepID=UPI00397BEBD7
SASLLFLAGIFEFGEGLLHARNAHGEGGWLKELSVPKVGTVGYFCSASLGKNDGPRSTLTKMSTTASTTGLFDFACMEKRVTPYDTVRQIKISNHVFASKMA